MNLFSSYLYARPSWSEGVARIVDFGNTLQEYNTSLTTEQADYLALLSDWLTVGNDLRIAMSEYKEVQSHIGDKLIQEACEALESARI
ncbi:hypothetical protein VB620_10280 [Nodularia harveyana UHCC-0300]|uniref:Uncharacterized protein n=1 Tax=Nodularia harveyana UHCC-0300 TaxID=2974287 RepID=A0ABU5UDY2_9CYAN|nr:hypothetical protein [Nodularia harveyana]MEA5581723.1 hypothetical protein [Nodularia harveyana UHCC-0300]